VSAISEKNAGRILPFLDRMRGERLSPRSLGLSRGGSIWSKKGGAELKERRLGGQKDVVLPSPGSLVLGEDEPSGNPFLTEDSKRDLRVTKPSLVKRGGTEIFVENLGKRDRLLELGKKLEGNIHKLVCVCP